MLFCVSRHSGARGVRARMFLYKSDKVWRFSALISKVTCLYFKFLMCDLLLLWDSDRPPTVPACLGRPLPVPVSVLFLLLFDYVLRATLFQCAISPNCQDEDTGQSCRLICFCARIRRNKGALAYELQYLLNSSKHLDILSKSSIRIMTRIRLAWPVRFCVGTRGRIESCWCSWIGT